jgi:hypothetical protein
MEIKLPHVPFKFTTPDGPMEIAVRCGPVPTAGDRSLQFAATASFIGHGPRALERIALSARADTYHGVAQTLKAGFKVSPQAHDKASVEYRVLTALCTAADVMEAD